MEVNVTTFTIFTALNDNDNNEHYYDNSFKLFI